MANLRLDPDVAATVAGEGPAVTDGCSAVLLIRALQCSNTRDTTEALLTEFRYY